MMRSRGMGPRTATLRLADTTTLQTSRPGTGRSAARGLGEAFAATGTGPDTCTRRGPVPFGALYAGMALQCILGVAENMGLEPLIAEGAARVKPLLQSARSRHAARRAWRSSPRSCEKLAQYGRIWNGASTSSISAVIRSTAFCSRFQVKWSAKLSL